MTAAADSETPAPEFRPATGAELIRRFEEIFKRHIVASKGVPLIGALYAFMTHCFKVFSWIAYLSFFSPLESCGKSHAADVVGWASARPEILVSITEAALFRLITEETPTVVIDEAEVLSGDGETAKALRAVLHAGCAPDDGIIRCAPNTHKLERFSPWCPKIFCTIDNLPRVLASRCIGIRMKRKGAGEREIKPFIRAKVKVELTKLGVEIAAWAQAHEAEIRRAYESLPDESFGDRAAENFAPLEAILAVADPDRLPEFRQARFSLMNAGNADMGHDEIRVQLLLDIKKTFEERRAEELPSTTLKDALLAIEESLWSEWDKGKPLTPAKLARLLRPFQVFPVQIANGQTRGYKFSHFRDCFASYIPPESVKVSETHENNVDDANFKVSSESLSDTSKNTVPPNNNAPSRRFDTLKAEIGADAEVTAGKTIFTNPAKAAPRKAGYTGVVL